MEHAREALKKLNVFASMAFKHRNRHLSKERVAYTQRWNFGVAMMLHVLDARFWCAWLPSRAVTRYCPG
jgi:hypothetical protein